MKSISNLVAQRIMPTQAKTVTLVKNGSSAKTGKNNTSHEMYEASPGLLQLFVAQLKDIYWTEKALVKALSNMMDEATAEELSSELHDHLAETKTHVLRCEEIFSLLNLTPEANPCEAMQGLITEAYEIIEETEGGYTRDAGIICAAQKIEHYEFATYGCMVAWAIQLGLDDAASLLIATLSDEKNAFMTLTDIAESVAIDGALLDLPGEG